jgi:hypothetical protein
MPRKTSFDELYTTLVNLITAVTGRPTWRKTGIQATPAGPYATIYLKEGPSPTQDVVENVDIIDPADGQPSILEYPVGLTRLECTAEFLRDANQSAYDAGIRFRQSLQMEARWYDLWEIAGLVGTITIRDISQMFRADVEGRTEIHFNLYADIGALPLDGSTDNQVYEFDSQGVGVFKEDLTPPAIATLNVSRQGGIQ